MAPLTPWLRLCFGPPLRNFLRTPLHVTVDGELQKRYEKIENL